MLHSKPPRALFTQSIGTTLSLKNTEASKPPGSLPLPFGYRIQRHSSSFTGFYRLLAEHAPRFISFRFNIHEYYILLPHLQRTHQPPVFQSRIMDKATMEHTYDGLVWTLMVVEMHIRYTVKRKPEMKKATKPISSPRKNREVPFAVDEVFKK
ncbi:hypothetical protein LXL04_028326 [Taraxacum kok-saghyz]